MRPLKISLLLLLLGVNAQAQIYSPEATRLNKRAVELMNQKRNSEEAVELMAQALRLRPGNRTFQRNRVEALVQAGRYTDALAEVNDFLHVAPQDSVLLTKKISILSVLGLPSLAHYERLKLLGTSPNENPALTELRKSQVWSLLSFKDFAPRVGEIRIDGFVSASPSQSNKLMFEAMLFASPNGSFRVFDSPKIKTLTITQVEPEYGEFGPLPVSQLRQGDYLAVVGVETAKGFVARRIVVTPRTPEEEKIRGSLFDIATVPLVENQDHPEIKENLIGEAEFVLGDKQSLHSYAAVIVNDKDKCALLTTLGSFRDAESELLSQKPPLTSAMLANVKEVRGLETHGDQTTLKTKNPLTTVVSSAFSGGEIVAVAVDSVTPAVSLASQNPRRGELVYLAGRYDGSIWWIEAKVAYVDAKRLVLHIRSQGEEGRVPGGAIVNAKGEIVGLHAAGTAPLVSAISVDALRGAMQKATQ